MQLRKYIILTGNRMYVCFAYRDINVVSQELSTGVIVICFPHSQTFFFRSYSPDWHDLNRVLPIPPDTFMTLNIIRVVCNQAIFNSLVKYFNGSCFIGTTLVLFNTIRSSL